MMRTLPRRHLLHRPDVRLDALPQFRLVAPGDPWRRLARPLAGREEGIPGEINGLHPPLERHVQDYHHLALAGRRERTIKWAPAGIGAWVFATPLPSTQTAGGELVATRWTRSTAAARAALDALRIEVEVQRAVAQDKVMSGRARPHSGAGACAGSGEATR